MEHFCEYANSTPDSLKKFWRLGESISSVSAEDLQIFKWFIISKILFFFLINERIWNVGHRLLTALTKAFKFVIAIRLPIHFTGWFKWFRKLSEDSVIHDLITATPSKKFKDFC